MTSKNSFLANVRENNKRRLWVWVVSALVFMLVLPIITALMLSSVSRQLDDWVSYYDMETARRMLKDAMLGAMQERFGFTVLMIFPVTGMAVVSAVQGFSWLYSRKKIDFYMGMPVKRKKRFLIIWVNGILLYVLPYLLGTIISLLVAAGNGAVDQSVLAAALVSFVADLCLYLGVYHLAMLAVMMTGNIVVTGFGFLVFCLYEFGVRTTISGYKQLFFKYHSYYGSNETPALSPFVIYADLAAAYEYQNVFEMKYLAYLILFALAVGVLAYICYLKRPAETAGKAMAFAVTKPVIKILLVVPVAMLAGLMVAQVINFEPNSSRSGIGYVILAIALVVVIGSAIIQVIYEFDIKGALHKKRHIAVSGVIAAAGFVVFLFDLFGYDDYIPKPEQVESAAFVPGFYEEIGGSTRFDDEGNYMSELAYAEKYMYLTNVQELCSLADISMRAYNELGLHYYKGSAVNLESVDGEMTGRWSQATVIYRLKSGRKVYRNFCVNVEDEETAGLLDGIMGSAEFKEGYFVSVSDRLDKLFEQERYQTNAAYGNTVYKEKLSEQEIKEFLEVYRRDFSRANFSNVKANVPDGVMTLTVSEELSSAYSRGMARATRSWELNLNVYPFYEESIAWLKERGYYQKQHILLEDVAQIQVLNHNYGIQQKLWEQQREQEGAQALEMPAGRLSVYDSNIDTRVYADYVEREDIEKLADCIYPRDMIVSDWDFSKELDSDYSVIVYFKTDSEMTKDYGTYAEYGFLEGEVPDFVRVDTAYKE